MVEFGTQRKATICINNFSIQVTNEADAFEFESVDQHRVADDVPGSDPGSFTIVLNDSFELPQFHFDGLIQTR